MAASKPTVRTFAKGEEGVTTKLGATKGGRVKYDMRVAEGDEGLITVIVYAPASIARADLAVGLKLSGKTLGVKETPAPKAETPSEFGF